MKSVAERIGQFIRQDVQSMHAYAIQPSTGMVKLDAMENPYSLPDELRQALGQRLGEVAINRYPGARIEALKQALARYADVPPGHGLMLGNGSDELISLMAMACDVPGGTLLAPEPGFVMYAMSAQLQGLKYVGVPLTTEFELDEAAMLAAMGFSTKTCVPAAAQASAAAGQSACGRKMAARSQWPSRSMASRVA